LCKTTKYSTFYCYKFTISKLDCKFISCQHQLIIIIIIILSIHQFILSMISNNLVVIFIYKFQRQLQIFIISIKIKNLESKDILKVKSEISFWVSNLKLLFAEFLPDIKILTFLFNFWSDQDTASYRCPLAASHWLYC